MSSRTSSPALPSLLTRRRSAWAVLVLSVLLSVGLVGALRGAEVSNDHGAAPPGSESATVAELLAQLPGHDVQHLTVVLTRQDGGALSDADLGEVAGLAAVLPAPAGYAVEGPIPAEDRRAALLQVPVNVTGSDSGAVRVVVEEVREQVAAGLPTGLSAQTTGGAALGADLAASFDGADVRLLTVTVGVVALLLLLTYRSPILWLVPLLVVGLADQVAGVVTQALGERLGLSFDPGIISVLVFGAGANYALLLISRYREELAGEADPRRALSVAWSATLPAILASNVSVVLALATLGLAVVPGTRGLGVAAATGLLVALAFAAVVLPAALVVVGRGVFWPFVPHPSRHASAEGRRRDPWGAVAGLVARRPWQVLAGAVALLAVMAGGLAGLQVGLGQAERFRNASESGAALEVMAEHFPSGSSAPMVVVTEPGQLEEVAAAVRAVPGVASVRPGEAGSTSTGEIATLMVTGDAAPGSQAERVLVQGVREAVQGGTVARALVGGASATELDAREGALEDLLRVVPLVLAVVVVVLGLLLRSVVAPAVLLAVNVLGALATIGAGAWLGRTVFGWQALDTSVPLLAFLFLVALGIDFTIFLVHRIRSEVPRAGTRAAVVRGVSTTGAVITSAGTVLAGVFAALGVLPLVTLGQLGLIVGLGVVLDTMLVRTLLVPAAITLLGDRFWWPGAPHPAAPPGLSRAGSPVREDAPRAALTR